MQQQMLIAGGPPKVWFPIGSLQSTVIIAAFGGSAHIPGTDNRMAHGNHLSNNLKAFDFNGTQLNQVGSTFTFTGHSYYVNLCEIDTNRIAMTTSTGTWQVYNFNGSVFTAIGSPSSAAAGQDAPFTNLSKNRVFANTSTSNVFRAFDFNGSTWSNVGNTITLTNNGRAARLNDTRIAFYDANTLDDIRAYDFDGTNWTQVGNPLSIPNTNYTLLDMVNLYDDHIAVVYNPSVGRWLRTYKFDGTDFKQVGDEYDMSVMADSNSRVAMCKLTENRVMISIAGNNQSHCFEFG